VFIALTTKILTSYCQIGYPKIINNQIDSCICISFDQARVINKTKFERDSYKTLSDSLESLNTSFRQKISLGEGLVSELQGKISLKDSLVVKEQKISLILRDENSYLRKQIKKKNTMQAIIYSIGGALITGLTTYIIISQ